MDIIGLADTFRRLARNDPDRIYAATLQGPLTFGTLSARADMLAASLHDAGLVRGDRVVVMMRNSAVSLGLVHALLRYGFVWVPTNPALVGDALAHAIELVDARIVVCDPSCVEALSACSAQAPLGRMVLDETVPNGEASALPAGAAPGPDELAALMFTSGTTGPSKAVMVTHRMLELAGHAVAVCAELRSGDDLYMWEPFYHIGGAQVLILPFLYDVTLTLRDRFSASTFWQDVAESGCTHIHHLGGIIQILLKQPPGPADRAHRVRIAWGGGCAPDAWRPFEERFSVELRECYGMTEASSLTTCNKEGVVGSIGRPMPWFTVEIVAQDGTRLGPDGGRGEIVVNTSLPGAIFPGYYRNSAASDQALRPDGFHTGDMGSWDANLMLRFHGRMGDSIRVRGENVSSYEVESVANQHPSIEESAMVGVPSDIGEHDILLFVRPRAETDVWPAELHAWLSARLPSYQQPRFISLVSEFPKTPSQRIQKHRLPQQPVDVWEAPNLRSARS